MSEQKFAALIDTIRRNGQTHPIQVVKDDRYKTPSKYRIVGGEHKWRAMKFLKMTEVTAIIRAFDDDTEEQLSSIEDNLHGSSVPIKEALIIASATKKYSLPQLQKRLGEDQRDLKDKLLLVTDAEKLDKVKQTLNSEHTVEFSLLLGTTPQQDAERFVTELKKFATGGGAKIIKCELGMSKTKDTIVFVTFNVSELQKNVIEKAVEYIINTEDVNKARAVEFMAAEFLAGVKNYANTKKESKKTGARKIK